MKTLTYTQKNELKLLLQKQKHRLTKRLESSDHYGLAASIHETPRELSNYDNHPADSATDLFEQSKDIALNENTEENLREVNEALSILDTAHYGICITCKQPIPFERLQVIPETRFCVVHTPEQELSNNRPIEEQVLPYQRSDDSEDAWQIVESWGNSNTPAMSADHDVYSYNDLTIDADESEGYVEAYESFVATDIYGKQVSIVRNKAYREYLANQEGDPLLELDEQRDS